MNCKFLHIPFRCKIEQPATRQRNGIKNSEMEIACESFIKTFGSCFP